MLRQRELRSGAITALLTAAVALASLPISASAYCVLWTPNGNRLQWPNPPFVAIPNAIDPTGADLVAPAAVIGAVNAAEGTWNATPAAPRWTYVIGGAGAGDPFIKDGINLIGFRDLSGLGLHANTYGVTATWYIVGGPNDGVITEIGIAMNIDPTRTWQWVVGPATDNQVDIETMALHHLGHGLGLGHTDAGGLGGCEGRSGVRRRGAGHATPLQPIRRGQPRSAKQSAGGG